MKVAVAKYPIQAPADFAAFAERQAAVLGAAAAQGARVAVLPEYLSLELAATFDAAPLQAMDLRARMRFLRTAAKEAVAEGLPWQSVMERIRPHVQALWQSLPLPEQRRFLRHGVRQWDVHRHRIAPEVHARHEGGHEAEHPPVPGELSVGPDEQGVTSYVFDEPGTVEMACHLPGHYAFGMRGEIAVVARDER